MTKMEKLPDIELECGKKVQREIAKPEIQGAVQPMEWHTPKTQKDDLDVIAAGGTDIKKKREE